MSDTPIVDAVLEQCSERPDHNDLSDMAKAARSLERKTASLRKLVEEAIEDAARRVRFHDYQYGKYGIEGGCPCRQCEMDRVWLTRAKEVVG